MKINVPVFIPAFSYPRCPSEEAIFFIKINLQMQLYIFDAIYCYKYL